MSLKNWMLSCLIGLLSLACNPAQNVQQQIQELEQKLEADNNSEDATTLSRLYQTYVDQNPEDHELNARYLYRAAGLEYRMNNAAKALELIKRALKDHYASSNTAKNVELMEKIYRENLGNQEVANTISQALEGSQLEGNGDASPVGLPPVLERLDTLRANIFNSQTYGINFPVANNYILAVEAFVLVNPDHPQSSALLFKAGEVARSIQVYNKAIDLLGWINAKYPQSKENAQALFLRAFTLDDGLKNYEEAQVAYEQFIEQYPDDPFADDAKFSLENLGKDVNELIENFKQQTTEEQ